VSSLFRHRDRDGQPSWQFQRSFPYINIGCLSSCMYTYIRTNQYHHRAYAWAYTHIPIQPACRCIWIGRRLPIGFFELHYTQNQTELTDVVAPRTNSPPLCAYEANTRTWSTFTTALDAKLIPKHTQFEVFSTRAVLAARYGLILFRHQSVLVWAHIRIPARACVR
jgi:hypothetical protein